MPEVNDSLALKRSAPSTWGSGSVVAVSATRSPL